MSKKSNLRALQTYMLSMRHQYLEKFFCSNFFANFIEQNELFTHGEDPKLEFKPA